MTKEEAIAVFECLATEITAILAGIPKSEAAAGQIKRYIDAYDIAVSAEQFNRRSCVAQRLRCQKNRVQKSIAEICTLSLFSCQKNRESARRPTPW